MKASRKPGAAQLPPVAFSLEVFPPKTEEGLVRLRAAAAAYAPLRPALITVTFGAGGAAASAPLARRALREVAALGKAPVAAHITFAGRTRDEVDATLADFWDDGVRSFVALRGDLPVPPEGAVAGAARIAFRPHPEGYADTPAFVARLKTLYPDAQVFVAGYPETHPESPSQAFDLDHLKRKVDAGADAVLTQFFFDPEVFLRWRDKAAAQGINVPLIPGLLPILNFPNLVTFAAKCQASVPPFLATMFEDSPPEGLDHKLLAMNVLSHQITRLITAGVDRFHFYTLNETTLTRHVCVWLRAGF